MNDKQGNLSNLLLNFSFIDQKKYRILCRTEKKKRKRICILATTELSQNDRKPTMNHLFPSTPASTTNNFFLDTLHVITGRKKKRKNRTPPFLLQNPQIIPRILINVHAHVASNETLYEFIRQEFPYRGGESLVEAHASSNETTTSE